MQVQPGDEPRPTMSFLGNISMHPQQLHCHITKTTSKTHAIIAENIELSAMYSGNITGTGPRYCPSIEDKIMRFADKDSHQVFIEPEGLNSKEIYPNGISTSLPFHVQHQFVTSILGFENAHITRYGYAIEYDYFDPRGLTHSLETNVAKIYFLLGKSMALRAMKKPGHKALLQA